MNAPSKIKQLRQEEMFAHVEHFRESKLTQKEYCQRHGLSKDEIYYWIKKYEQVQNPVSPVTNRFVPVEICKPAIGRQDKLTIHYPNGVQVSLPSDISITLIRSLISISY